MCKIWKKFFQSCYQWKENRKRKYAGFTYIFLSYLFWENVFLFFCHSWLIHRIMTKFLQFQLFPLVTWGCVSPTQILWLCRPIHCQNIHFPWLYKKTKSKLVLLPKLSLFFLLFFLFSLQICTTFSHFSSALFLVFLCFLSGSVPHFSTCSAVSSSIAHNQHNGCSSSLL